MRNQKVWTPFDHDKFHTYWTFLSPTKSLQVHIAPLALHHILNMPISMNQQVQREKHHVLFVYLHMLNVLFGSNWKLPTPVWRKWNKSGNYHLWPGYKKTILEGFFLYNSNMLMWICVFHLFIWFYLISIKFEESDKLPLQYPRGQACFTWVPVEYSIKMSLIQPLYRIFYLAPVG